MIVEALVGSLILGAYLKKRSADKTQELHPHIVAQREVIFDTAINSLKDPAKLRELASAFRSQNMLIQADLLEKRAALSEASPEVKAQRRAVLTKALESKDKAAVLNAADAFDSMGATGAADTLRAYANGLADNPVEMGRE